MILCVNSSKFKDERVVVSKKRVIRLTLKLEVVCPGGI
jgi:hypothetical protein